jgi:hypothetical protein
LLRLRPHRLRRQAPPRRNLQLRDKKRKNDKRKRRFIRNK